VYAEDAFRCLMDAETSLPIADSCILGKGTAVSQV